MDMSQVHSIASRLVELYGAKAEVEAVRKLREAERTGDTDATQMWQRVRSAVREMKAAHES